MTIVDLLKIQDTYEFEEFGTLDLLIAEKTESDLKLQSQIYTGVENEPKQFMANYLS